ncbi:hypothetical protein F4824DRAFT_450304 [Ustulina deusta]|nr:hypothetical protein F4824DRAFT_450304 [Ustulina deusta]
MLRPDFDSCERQPSSHQMPPSEDTPVSPRRKQKLNHPPPSLRDNLSNIPLTRSALRELDRRNTENLLFSQAPRPLYEPLQPPTQYLHNCIPTELNNIVRFSRGGGPDLSDLRGHSKGIIIIRRGMRPEQSSQGRHPKRSLAAHKGPIIVRSRTSRTKSTERYDKAFRRHRADDGIYYSGYTYNDRNALSKPDNPNYMKEVLAKPRDSLSPTRVSGEDFDIYARNVGNIQDEGDEDYGTLNACYRRKRRRCRLRQSEDPV